MIKFTPPFDWSHFNGEKEQSKGLSDVEFSHYLIDSHNGIEWNFDAIGFIGVTVVMILREKVVLLVDDILIFLKLLVINPNF